VLGRCFRPRPRFAHRNNPKGALPHTPSPRVAIPTVLLRSLSPQRPAKESRPGSHHLVFAPFRLDLASEQLWRGTALLLLRPTAFLLLRYLAEPPERLVTQEELLKVVFAAAQLRQ
jgi:DNA-binding response OmpR family regulator